MQKNSGNFSIKEARRLAESPAGKQLISQLQNTGGDQLRNAVDQAAAGNYEAVKKTLAPLLASPEIQELLKQLGG